MTLPDDMIAVEIARPGGPEVLTPVRRALPEPDAGEILIRVEAAGVNRPDVMQREGRYPPPPGASDLPGLEVAGEIAALGDGATGAHGLGDRVMALVPGGGYAEFCRAPAGHALAIPDALSAVEAGAMPETVFTVWSNVFVRARLQPGETLLVHGGSSGIGSMAIRMAGLFGSPVLATAGSAEKCTFCRQLGAARAINYREEDFVAATLEATDGRGADVILDMVGGEYMERNFRAAAVEGRIAVISFLGGARAGADFTPLLVKRLTLTGSTLRPRSNAEKAALADELAQRIWPHVEAGRLRPVIDSTFALNDAAEAHRRMDSGAHMGKIVLLP